jgi:predicted glycosyltransferase
MKVSYYCQHVLGIGHFHRSMDICKAIARHHPTTLILGGPPVEIAPQNIHLLKLPGLQMDSNFQNLEPCDSGLSLAEVKEKRKNILFNHFKQTKPNIFITELYPFGRKAFRFELDPVLNAIREGSLPNCSCYCSIRDILVEKKTGREKFEKRVVQVVNTYFDGILVHADPKIITLNETFSRLADIQTPLYYTGFVTRSAPESQGAREEMRKKLALSPESKLIVASIGGGNVGSELLSATIQAFKILEKSLPAHLQIFCGPYCDEKMYTTLQSSSQDNIKIDRFTEHFPRWLAAADLSISMAGYNTCMNLVQAGIPALVYPFKQNREQRLRAERLGKRAPIAIIEETDLSPLLLSKKIVQHIATPRLLTEINLDGVKETVRQLGIWYTTHSCHC